MFSAEPEANDRAEAEIIDELCQVLADLNALTGVGGSMAVVLRPTLPFMPLQISK